MSHYRIWQEVVEKKMDRVIIFEDDLRFMVNSTDLLKELIEDIDSSRIEWDLVYLGRKRLEGANENWVPGKLSDADFANSIDFWLSFEDFYKHFTVWS